MNLQIQAIIETAIYVGDLEEPKIRAKMAIRNGSASMAETVGRLRQVRIQNPK